MTGKPREPPAIDLSGVHLRPLRMADVAALHGYFEELSRVPGQPHDFYVYGLLRSDWGWGS